MVEAPGYKFSFDLQCFLIFFLKNRIYIIRLIHTENLQGRIRNEIVQKFSLTGDKILFRSLVTM